MKNNQIFTVSESAVVGKGKHTAETVYAVHSTLRYVDRRFRVPDKLNVISINKDLYNECNHAKLILFKEGSQNFLCVTAVVDNTLSREEFMATAYVREQLSLYDNDSVLLCRYDERTYNQVFTQKVENIRENILVVSKTDSSKKEIKTDGSNHFEVYNPFSGDSIVVKASHIKVDPALPAGTVRLNRKQRIFLGLELPLFLTDEQWETITQCLGEQQRSMISEAYGTSDHILRSDVSYEIKQECQSIIKNLFGNEVRIIPVPETLLGTKKAIGRSLCNFYVGKSTISLIAKRPYDNDEGLDIVRMTHSNMNLLGINEMDKVVFQYKNKELSCRVLELDSEDSFLKTNRPVPIDLVIGIPIHIRKRLGIDDLTSAIKIDRDTIFIFKKSINEQVVPILLTLFSANLFSDSSILVSAMLSLIAVPIVLYFNLSSKRNMRA